MSINRREKLGLGEGEKGRPHGAGEGDLLNSPLDSSSSITTVYLILDYSFGLLTLSYVFEYFFIWGSHQVH